MIFRIRSDRRVSHICRSVQSSSFLLKKNDVAADEFISKAWSLSCGDEYNYATWLKLYYVLCDIKVWLMGVHLKTYVKVSYISSCVEVNADWQDNDVPRYVFVIWSSKSCFVCVLVNKNGSYPHSNPVPDQILAKLQLQLWFVQIRAWIVAVCHGGVVHVVCTERFITNCRICQSQK